MNEHESKKYGVFLSYAHKDAEKYGKHYVMMIKEAIEGAIQDLALHSPDGEIRKVASEYSQVFLDVSALREGDLWQSKIIEKLNECLVFVCLLSENYKNSKNCSRERIWWSRREIQKGRLLKDTLPIYYVKLDEGLFSETQPSDIRNLASLQIEDVEPWFGEEFGDRKHQTNIFNMRLRDLQRVVKDKMEAGIKAHDSFSSLDSLNRNFVGRVDELIRLHEMCQHAYPIVHGEGGVGKTQLALAYAKGFADEYPEGRYLIRMEGVHSWDEAFAKMLRVETALEPVWKHLGIDEDIIKKKASEQHLAAIKALAAKATNGRLLVVLDNADDDNLFKATSIQNDMFCRLTMDKIRSNIHIIATTRPDHNFRFNERSDFQPFELKNLNSEDAFELLCLQGNNQYPFANCPPDDLDKQYLEEYEAAHEYVRMLQNHAWSLEIDSAFMAEHYADGFTFKKRIAELYEQFKLNPGQTIHGANSPDDLLKPTLNKISDMEHGKEILDLLAFTACFNADEIPLNILKYYWRDCCQNTNGQQDIPFDIPKNRLERYHLIAVHDEMVKMHRLTQSVLRKRALEQSERIGIFLKSCMAITQEYMTNILIATPELFDFCSDYMISPKMWIKLLKRPQLVARCPWKKFGGYEWSMLLQEYPDIANENDVTVAWKKLNGEEWSDLLQKQPDIVSKNNVTVEWWKKLNGNDWCWLLREQPTIAKKYKNIKISWRKLSCQNWCLLLRKQPTIANENRIKVPWGKFDKRDWIELLSQQLTIAKDNQIKVPWENFDGYDWMYILQWQPTIDKEYKVDIPWKKFDSAIWSYFLTNYNLLKIIEEKKIEVPWQKFDGNAWSMILPVWPIIAKMYPNKKIPWKKLSAKNWSELLKYKPKIAKDFNETVPWEKLSSKNWLSLLWLQPNILQEYKVEVRWEKRLSANDWSWLLTEQPNIAWENHVEVPWAEFTGKNWSRLLSEKPNIAHEYNVKIPWAKFTSKDLMWLLIDQPQFVNHCQDYLNKKLSKRDRRTLFYMQPQLKKCKSKK